MIARPRRPANQHPHSSPTQAFNLLASGAISNGFTASITTALSKYYPDNLNDGHIEYFYYVSAAGAVIAIPLYLFFASRFHYKNYSKDEPLPTQPAKVVDPMADFEAAIAAQQRSFEKSNSAFGGESSSAMADTKA